MPAEGAHRASDGSAAARASKGATRPRAQARATERILIVDDDEDVRTTMQDVLGLMMPQLQVSLCGTAAEALALLRSPTRFDAVVTDYQMPGMDGLGLIEAAHGMDPTLPLVLATAFTGEETRELALQKGAFGFLPKPFSATELADSITSALRSKGRMPQVRGTSSRQERDAAPLPPAPRRRPQ